MRGFAVSLLLAVASQAVHGQAVVSGSVVTSDSAFVLGALVLAIDSTTSVAATRITGPDGRFEFRLSTGVWTIRAERIGLGSAEEVLRLSRSEKAEITLRVSPDPIALEGLTVSSLPRCEDHGAQESLAALWRRARRILVDLSGGSERDGPDFLVARTMRHLAPGNLNVLDETIDSLVTHSVVPMRSASPEFLARNGFAVAVGDTAATYYAPDAAVLLSDIFLSSHCFVRVGRPDEQAEGLEFKPIRMSKRPDIAGTFWFPRAGAPFIEFTFTAHPWEFDSDEEFGGYVEFEEIEGVGWAVTGWRLRIPVLMPVGRRSRNWALLMIREWGAHLLDVRH